MPSVFDTDTKFNSPGMSDNTYYVQYATNASLPCLLAWHLDWIPNPTLTYPAATQPPTSIYSCDK